MQLNNFYNECEKSLQKNQIVNASMEAQWIFCQVLNLPNSALLFALDRKIKPEQAEQIEQMLNRRVQGEPLAYILGNCEFYGIEFLVNSNVLIPRADTESLVDFVLENQSIQDTENALAFKGQNFKVLDLCTGSGIIGLTLKKHRPKWQVSLSDISLPALQVAKKNANRLNLEAEILESDLFASIADKFDLIISNPPYIAENDEHLASLKHEPILALTARNDGLAILQKIVEDSKDYMHPNAKLVLEHGYNQADVVARLMAQNAFINVENHKDLAGNFRFSSCSL